MHELTRFDRATEGKAPIRISYIFMFIWLCNTLGNSGFQVNW